MRLAPAEFRLPAAAARAAPSAVLAVTTLVCCVAVLSPPLPVAAAGTRTVSRTVVQPPGDLRLSTREFSLLQVRSPYIYPRTEAVFSNNSVVDPLPAACAAALTTGGIVAAAPAPPPGSGSIPAGPSPISPPAPTGGTPSTPDAADDGLVA